MIATDTVLETGSLDLPDPPPPPPHPHTPPANVANNAKLVRNYGRDLELIIE